MSAPMESRLPTKEIFNLLIRLNLFFVIFLFFLIYFPLNSNTSLDLISESLKATKALTIAICFYNVLSFVFMNLGGQQTQSTTKTNVKVKNFIKSLGILAISIIFFHTTAVLYGAPLFESATETFHFSLLLTTTAILPPLCVLGVNLSSWIRVFAQNGAELGAESIVLYSTVCSIIGAWLGAFPIPLDWDRPWQVWPISCVFGTVIGYIMGVAAGTIHLYFKYHRLRKVKIT